jgi:hypothetical protein
MNSIREQFQSDGYFLQRAVFSAEEIAHFRDLVYRQYEVDARRKLTYTLSAQGSHARYAKGDLLSKELLYPILLDERVLRLAQEVLGSTDLTYFGDSSYQIGTGLRGFHRDSLDRTNLDGEDWKSPYTLVRLGIYLQSHRLHSGGLKVKPGTHQKADGPSVFVNNDAGDLVIWSLMLLHSGNAVRIKGLPNWRIDSSSIENRIPSFLKREEEKERISLFMTFAVPSHHLDRYIDEYELKRSDTIEHLKSSRYSTEAMNAARDKGVTVKVLFPENQLA